jgi:hypothetical protein
MVTSGLYYLAELSGNQFIFRFISGITTGMSMIMQSRKTQAAPPNRSTAVYCRGKVARIKRPAAIKELTV